VLDLRWYCDRRSIGVLIVLTHHWWPSFVWVLGLFNILLSLSGFLCQGSVLWSSSEGGLGASHPKFFFWQQIICVDFMWGSWSPGLCFVCCFCCAGCIVGSRLELCTSCCYNKLSLQLGGITQSRWWSEKPWIGG
jgi:hypothetical protein